MAFANTTASITDNGTTPFNDNRPVVVFNPTRSFHAAGIRTEPPVSDPIPAAAILNATEAPAPDEDPPETASRSFTQGGVSVEGL